MDELLTREFVKRWNEKNGYSNEISYESNMRYVSAGRVSWNQFDAEEVDIAEFVNIYKELNP